LTSQVIDGRLAVFDVLQSASDPGPANCPAKKEGIVFVILDEKDHLHFFVHGREGKQAKFFSQSSF
jgi:hypothetical protein